MPGNRTSRRAGRDKNVRDVAAAILAACACAAGVASEPPPTLVVQSGHVAPLQAAVFSPDGALLATGGADEVVKLWDVAMGREVRTLVGSRGPLYAVRFGADGRTLATGGWDRMARVWDLASGALVAALGPHDATVQGVALSPDGRTLAAGTFDDRAEGDAVWVWDVPSQKLLRRLPVAGIIRAVAFDPAGARIAVGLRTGARVAVFSAQDGTLLRELSWDPPPRAPPVKSGVIIREQPEGVTALAWSPSGQRIAAVCRDQAVLLDTAGAAAPQVGAADVFDLEFDGEGALLAMGRTGTVRWHVGTGRAEAFSPAVGRPSRDGTLVAHVDGRDVVLLDRASGAPVRRFTSPLRLPKVFGNLSRYFTVAASPMYPVVAAGGVDARVHVWDLRAGVGPRVLDAGEPVRALAFDAQGKLLAAAAGNRVRLWWTDGWHEAGTVELPDAARDLAFDPRGGGALAVLAERRVHLVDLAARAVVKTVDTPTRTSETNGAGGIAWAPDGTLVTGGGQQITFWGTDLVARKTAVGHPLAVNAIAVAPAGRLAVGGGYVKWSYGQASDLARDDSIILVSGAAEPSLKKLSGHRAQVRAVAFDLDGQVLASGGADGLVKLWDVASGCELASFQAHGGDVTGVAFTSDGRYAVSTGMDGAIRLWDVAARRPAAALVSLGEEEWVAALEDGTYAASKPGLRGVAFNVENRAVPFERYDLRLNRPDLVWGRLGYALPDLLEAYRLAHQQRLRRMGLAQAGASESLAAPRLQLRSERPPPATAAATVRLRVRAEDGGGGLDRIVAYVNEVPVPSRVGFPAPPGATAFEHEIELPLAAGDNEIAFSALSRGGVESSRQTFRVVRVGAAARPVLRVATIGVSAYRDPALALRYAAKDARDVAAALARRGSHFARVEDLVQVDGDATRAALTRARAFLAASALDDEVVVFFSGHGLLRGGRYWFLPADVDLADLERTAIPYEALEDLLDGIPARRRLLLIDTCHAGELDADSVSPGTPPLAAGVVARAVKGVVLLGEPAAAARTRGASAAVLGELFADLRRGTGAAVIAASGAAEYALEGAQWQNGVFTAAVLEALRDTRADADRDGTLRVSELQRWVTARVRELTGGRQSPTARRENLVDDFPVR